MIASHQLSPELVPMPQNLRLGGAAVGSKELTHTAGCAQ